MKDQCDGCGHDHSQAQSIHKKLTESYNRILQSAKPTDRRLIILNFAENILNQIKSVSARDLAVVIGEVITDGGLLAVLNKPKEKAKTKAKGKAKSGK
jgi:hypothetical protein